MSTVLLVSATLSSFCVIQVILSTEPSKVIFADAFATSLQHGNHRAPAKFSSLHCSHWHLKNSFPICRYYNSKSISKITSATALSIDVGLVIHRAPELYQGHKRKLKNPRLTSHDCVCITNSIKITQTMN